MQEVGEARKTNCDSGRKRLDLGSLGERSDKSRNDEKSKSPENDVQMVTILLVGESKS